MLLHCACVPAMLQHVLLPARPAGRHFVCQPAGSSTHCNKAMHAQTAQHAPAPAGATAMLGHVSGCCCGVGTTGRLLQAASFCCCWCCCWLLWRACISCHSCLSGADPYTLPTHPTLQPHQQSRQQPAPAHHRHHMAAATVACCCCCKKCTPASTGGMPDIACCCCCCSLLLLFAVAPR